MDPVLEVFHKKLTGLHEGARKALDGLTPEQLDWKPGEDMNSLAVLAAHIAGAERFWFGDVILGQPTGRNRDLEFATRGATEESLATALDSALELAGRALAGLGAGQLGEVRVSPRDGREYSIAWAVAHMLEHTAQHVGHMDITRQLVKADS
jgi:uncharacterized damage-inducible protein DinB